MDIEALNNIKTNYFKCFLHHNQNTPAPYSDITLEQCREHTCIHVLYINGPKLVPTSPQLFNIIVQGKKQITIAMRKT